MTKEQLFEKYHINEGHKVWEPAIDNWFSVEIFKQMHGRLPEPEDTLSLYILDFIDKTADPSYFFALKNPGSHFTTAKRMVYRYAEQILEDLSKPLNKETE